MPNRGGPDTVSFEALLRSTREPSRHSRMSRRGNARRPPEQLRLTSFFGQSLETCLSGLGQFFARQHFVISLICKLFERKSDANSAARPNRMESISVRTTKKMKKVVRREWTPSDVKVLKKHSKAKTPIEKVSKETKRTIGALRVKASQLGIGLGHQR
jgi:hypothetical protein